MWKVAWGVVVGLFLFFVGLPALGVLLLIGGLALQHPAQQIAPAVAVGAAPSSVGPALAFVIGIAILAVIFGKEWRRTHRSAP